MAARSTPAARPGRVRPETTDGWGPWSIPVYLLVALAVAAGLVLRFWTRSPLWLDEALSVNIARLPIGQIPEALRHDGHPPLYYMLLHGWMALFGQGNFAVRTLSGLWSVAAFPLLWIAARRLGGRQVALYAVTLLAVSPFAVRYGTETRMYAMVMVFSLVGWLLVDDALRRPTLARLAGIAVVVGMLLWSHYWSMWLLASGAAALAFRAWRARRRDDREAFRASVSVLGAFFAGGVMFLPWIPVLLYQGAHTGTPWARPVRPTEMVSYTLADLGGGPQSEAVILGWAIAALAAVGLAGRAVDRYRIEIDVRTRRRGRPFAILVAGTVAIACAVGYATGATYATRYASVFIVFVFLLAALGMGEVRSRPIAAGLMAGLVLFGAVGSARNVTYQRSDAVQSANAVRFFGKATDLVVYCPDQLGPSTSRLVDSALDQVTYPDFAPPQRVNWVDYKERLGKASPQGFALQVLERARDRRIFYVFNTGYNTHRGSCREIYDALANARAPDVLTQPTGSFEPSIVALFSPVATTAPG